MPLPVPPFHSNLKLLPFGSGGDSAPNRLNFPFFGWMLSQRRDTNSRVRLSRQRAGKDSGCL